MSAPAPPKLDITQVRRVDKDDDKTFTVCVLSADIGVAPALAPKKVGDMASDGCKTLLEWSDGRHLGFHRVKGSTGSNDLASLLAHKRMFGDVYIVATQKDHAMIDFPPDLLEAISGVHGEMRSTPAPDPKKGGSNEKPT